MIRIHKKSFSFDEQHRLLTTEADLLGPRKAREVALDAPAPLTIAKPHARAREFSGVSRGTSLTEGPLRVEWIHGSFFVVGSGLEQPISVDSRSEGEQEIASLRAECAADLPPLILLTCRDFDSGIRHDPQHQDPHDDLSCECVRPPRSEAVRDHGSLSWPARFDDPAPCRVPEILDIPELSIRVHLCCRCSVLIHSNEVAETMEATSAALPRVRNLRAVTEIDLGTLEDIARAAADAGLVPEATADEKRCLDVQAELLREALAPEGKAS